MSKKEVLANLIDSKKSAILQTTLHSNEPLVLKEIANKSNVSLASTHRILQELVNLNVLERKVWKTAKTYSVQNNTKVDFLKSLYDQDYNAIQDFLTKVKNLSGIKQIMQHGTSNQKEANLILIGEYINNNRIEDVCQEIKKKGFEISFVTLTKVQFEQMSKMGVYPEIKTILS